jgi:hypothetical protein
MAILAKRKKRRKSRLIGYVSDFRDKLSLGTKDLQRSFLTLLMLNLPATTLQDGGSD